MNGHRSLILAVALASLTGTAKEPPPFTGDIRQYWTDVCARCHGINGNGRDASGRPLPDAGFDFTDSRKANRRKNEKWVRIIQDGHEKMPAFKGRLPEAETRRMVTEILRPFAARP